MTKNRTSARRGRFAAFALGAVGAALTTPAFAQETAPVDEPVASTEIVVLGKITYRNRSEEIAPVLDYGLDYFQRFEPLTVGDMMKRVPSVAFVSDVLEYDGAQLRGLDPSYTQILINGEKVPGSGVDRSFFVDRIPAELVERIEIVRSASATRSGDAVAGALNIVLRDAYALDGGYLRAGALYFDGDQEWKPTFGGVYGGKLGNGRFLLGGNIQGRHNPKEKISTVYSEPPATPANFDDERAYQSDVRDGTDYSFNAALFFPVLDGGELELTGFYTRTDRTETEKEFVYDDLISIANANLLEESRQLEEILQDNFNVSAKLTVPWQGGETKFKLGFAQFKDDIVETETAIEYDPFPTIDDQSAEILFNDTKDREWSARVEHTRTLGGFGLDFGIDYTSKKRDTEIIAGDIGDPSSFAPEPGGLNEIEERRVDPFVELSRKGAVFSWEAGLRYETTDSDVRDFITGTAFTNGYEELLPSFSLKWNLTEKARAHVSLARTLKRPSFDFLAPNILEEEYGDNDFEGNPRLVPEKAWGIDVGVEHRLGKLGVAGVNAFYRDVTDVIEVYNTGLAGPSGEFLFSARNSGDGKVWGVEFDLSTPLTVIRLPNTGLFLNYSLLDSEIDDEFGSRRFNNQPEYVLNVGFIHDMPNWGAAFGATYRKQGEARERVVGEEVKTTYDADLEVFVEKRIGERFTVRMTGSNLLDASKDEVFDTFSTLPDHLARDYDAFETETEQSGPSFQIVGRLAF